MAKETKYTPSRYTEAIDQSTSKTQQTTETRKVLDEALLQTIMSGLSPKMTDAQIRSYAESLLQPVLNAGIESAQQQQAAAELAGEQEIENLAAALTRSIQEQQNAYRQSAANIETAALARGMGRSSYTLDTLAGQGNALAQAVRLLSEETGRQQAQVQKQIGLAQTQAAQTTGRLKTDYASQLAAKVQEIAQQQKAQHDSNYMTAISTAIGSKSSMDSSTTGTGSSLNIEGGISSDEGKAAPKTLVSTVKPTVTMKG